MDLTGSIDNIMRSFDGRHVLITLSLEEAPLDALQTLSDAKLSIELKKYHKRRSLDANAYAWVLISKMADVLKTSKEELYEELLRRYGVPYKDDTGYITITLKKVVDINRVGGHWLAIKENGDFISYMMIKGTSEYDTSEMSHFIDSIVEEAKELSIETLPPHELARMVEEWQKD